MNQTIEIADMFILKTKTSKHILNFSSVFCPGLQEFLNSSVAIHILL